MQILELGTIAALIGWLAITILFQFEPKFLRLNFHGFVPSCRFFAPNPMVTDARIYYTCEMSPGSALDEISWHPLIEAKKWRTRPFWNPHQRLEKTVHVVVRQIMRLNDETDHVELTVPYLRLLNIVDQRVRAGQGSGFVRFIITRHRGLEDTGRYITFASREHRVAGV
jgi:hypothetical protein